MKDWSAPLRVGGATLFLGGVFFAFVGPIEIYSFFLFSPGGRLPYAGFGIGSLLFADIATRIVGYYTLAIAGVVLGYGNPNLRRGEGSITNRPISCQFSAIAHLNPSQPRATVRAAVRS